MGRRWQKPRPVAPQQELPLNQRGRFTPPIKLATDTSREAAESIGLKRSGDHPGPMANIADLASAMVDVLRRHTSEVRLDGVMMAVEIRAKVYRTLAEACRTPERAGESASCVKNPGLTADEVAAKLGISILTIRPRVSELKRMGKIVDAGERRKNASGKNAIVWRITDVAQP